jgi:hypothetical protein
MRWQQRYEEEMTRGPKDVRHEEGGMSRGEKKGVLTCTFGEDVQEDDAPDVPSSKLAQMMVS